MTGNIVVNLALTAEVEDNDKNTDTMRAYTFRRVVETKNVDVAYLTPPFERVKSLKETAKVTLGP